MKIFVRTAKILAMCLAVFLVACGQAASAPASSSVPSSVPSSSAPKNSISLSLPPTSAEEGLLVGDIAPDFQLELRGGGTVRLSELRGKPVFLNISTTWCPPCQAEFPEVELALEKYQDKVNILVVSSGEALVDVDTFFDAKPYTFPVAYDPSGEMSMVYKVEFIPQSFFIDENGIIVEYIPGGSDLETFSGILDKMI